MQSDEKMDGHDGEADWIATKSLIDAVGHSLSALEYHCRYDQYHGDDPDAAEVEQHVEQAIVEHQRVLEDLEAALEALDGVDSD